MCEHFIARAAEPFRLDELWPFTERSSATGSPASAGARRGWTSDGRLASYRDVRAFRDDPGRDAVGSDRDDRRPRPSAATVGLSTLTLPDTQPFDDPAGRFAFSHNGDLRDYRSLRATYRAQGRIHGRADTEVGARWLEDAWRADEPAAHLLGGAPRPVRRPGQPRGPDRGRHAAPLRGQRREPGLRVPARADRRSCRRASTRSIGRSSGSSPRARRTAGWCRSRTTVALDRDGNATAAS